MDGWTREETDYLMELCDKYDLRFILVQDRWDRDRFKVERSVEDIKERYYMILDILNTVCDYTLFRYRSILSIISDIDR